MLWVSAESLVLGPHPHLSRLGHPGLNRRLPTCQSASLPAWPHQPRKERLEINKQGRSPGCVRRAFRSRQGPPRAVSAPQPAGLPASPGAGQDPGRRAGRAATGDDTAGLATSGPRKPLLLRFRPPSRPWAQSAEPRRGEPDLRRRSGRAASRAMWLEKPPGRLNPPAGPMV